MQVMTARGLTLAVGLALSLSFFGCGGGGSGSSAPLETGEVTVAVTDAPSDEIETFEVDISQFRFQHQNGSTVEILPQTTRVDFAELVTVSEVIAAATLPVGTYTSAFMTIDFSGAAVRIAGNPGAATVLDSQGQALTGTREFQIMFPGSGFVVGARRGHFAVVDFDLDQSLEVDVPANTVKVDTILFADVDPAQPKETRAPGLAAQFDGSGGFELDVRIGLGLVSRGRLTVTTTSTTVFDMGGQVETGQAGYDALAALGNNTLVVAAGTVDPLRRTMAAARVILLPQNLDEVGGLVVARSGGPGQDAVLTLRGVSVSRVNQSVTFNDTVTIQTSFASTQVNKRGVARSTLDTDAINVGQRILAYGSLSGSGLDLTVPGAGFVRMVETNVSGEVLTPPAGGQLQLDVSRIGRRLQGAFDFSVDGVLQADPAQFAVDTGTLGLANITSGSVVSARGFFPPVTAAPNGGDPDFLADTVVDRSNAVSLMRVWWLLGSSAPFGPGSASGIEVDISQATLAYVDRGLVVPTALTQNPLLSGQTNGFYAARRGLRLTLFRDFNAFKAHLEREVGGGAQVLAIRAIGRYDPSDTSLAAARSVVTMR